VGYAGRVLVEPVSAAAVNDVPVSAPTTDVRSAAQTLPSGAVQVSDAGTRLVPMLFWVKSPGANRVAIVGDFNGWDPAAATAVMKDPTRSGVWEVTLLLPPGRHSYAFLLNDSLQIADPRAGAESVDPDFGLPRSAVLVTER
jgi:1,4-alpha-glucan branching enzyme